MERASQSSSSAEPEYNLFWDQGDHLKELVTANKFNKAAELYGKHKPFFLEKEAKYVPSLRKAADALNAKHEPELVSALKALKAFALPASPSAWPDMRKALSKARKINRNYMDNPLLQEVSYRSTKANELRIEIKHIEKRLKTNASDAFLKFQHFGANSFFKHYPIDIEAKAFLAEHFKGLEPRLKRAPSTDIEAFARNYPEQQVSEDIWTRISNFHAGAKIREAKSRRHDFPTILQALSESKKAGFKPKSVPKAKIAFVEATSRTLLKEGQIEFPAKIDVDLPFRTTRADLSDALQKNSNSDYLVVFDVALAKTKRRISQVKKEQSKFVAGYKTVPNPDYAAAQAEVNRAQINLQQANMSAISADAQYCYGLGCLGKAIAQIAHAAAQSKAKQNLENAINGLSTTPMTIEKPVYQGYAFDRAVVKSTKTMTVHYYVIDRPSRKYFKSTFDVIEKKTFNVAYAVHDQDPNKKQLISAGDSEEDVAAWEDAPSSVALSQLATHYLTNTKKAKRLGSIVALKSEMLRDKNTALAKYAANTFDSQPRNDPRFDSVVVVFARQKSSLGTGFFIKPDVVLTNWHVVENATFVEMKTHDKQETFGKVFARDARLDLALIKVQSRGTPVRFYDKKTIDLGHTVEAIGHPKGLEFSITRGVVSAIRRHKTINLGQSGKPVLFVQTDAPINSGNSGGPLFLDDRVIGVNTWVFSKQIAEGLNFSVHYSEVLNFIRENLAEFQTSQTR